MTNKEADILCQLLNNDGEVPSFKYKSLKQNGKTYISVIDLQRFFMEMSHNALSDQKQEVYKGLFLLLQEAMNQ